MLVFKKNIYYSRFPCYFSTPVTAFQDEAASPLPCPLIGSALASDRALFQELPARPETEFSEHLTIMFPHAHWIGNAAELEGLNQRLWQAHSDSGGWWLMNAYHFVYLYDSLTGLVEEYSYGDQAQRKALCPELEGREFNFNQFLNEYFFNTVFLIDRARYDALPPEQRRLLGKLDHALMGALPPRRPLAMEIDPCLERVIHRIRPEPGHLVLQPVSGDPYQPPPKPP